MNANAIQPGVLATPHVHGAGAIDAAWILAVPFVVAAVIYVCAASAAGRRGRAWPWHRTACWLLGLVAASTGFTGPLAAAHGSFPAHMAAHLLVGMAAPMLLVLAAPMTLALRTLSVVPARRLSRLLRSPLVRVLTHPIVALLLSAGGMWLLYRSPLYDAMHEVTLVHVLVMLHFLISGYLFTAAVIGVDPDPRRSGFALRAGAVIVSVAAHALLAKLLYAHPLPGVPATEAQTGALLMFYGGDAIELALIAVLWQQWYRATGRGLARTAVGPAETTAVAR